MSRFWYLFLSFYNIIYQGSFACGFYQFYQLILTMRVTILHLDLGIGGAEQLIVNTVLKELGHDVTLLTTHHDKNHCFEETKPSGNIILFILDSII